MLRYRDDHIAIIETGELGNVRKLTYKQLYSSVAVCANACRNIGLKSGDRCVGYMPNTADTVTELSLFDLIQGDCNACCHQHWCYLVMCISRLW